MTTITMQLPDELVQQAKEAGVLNEQALAELCGQFLRTHIQLSNSQLSANQNIVTPEQKKETLTVAELAKAMTIKTDLKLTVEEMNEGIGKMFENWEG